MARKGGMFRLILKHHAEHDEGSHLTIGIPDVPNLLQEARIRKVEDFDDGQDKGCNRVIGGECLGCPDDGVRQRGDRYHAAAEFHADCGFDRGCHRGFDYEFARG